ncbi:DUF998 domain-containing protein [Methanobrevibacter thaueri]|uniref:DUF998 domain-containing protein n=1 Tax=Methanobrevibacter thaueri TaxID=190975 RepID=A0A315XN94_9EURY|nr:DUF998 domain-containing protein [Methanobrevibacter thaueri]PWB87344.1 hypothetical protein MBBTH_09090 [Methanobrevibacter thaueri]
MKPKVAGIVLLIGSLYYLIAEAISATFFNASIFNTYVFHTISELGIPNGNSPLFWLMNSAFILIGLALLFAVFYKFKDFIVKNNIIISIFTFITSIGVIVVGLIHGGNPLTLGYHAMGAVMAILGGNILLVLISRSMEDFGKYQKATLILGIIGLAAFWIMFFSMGSIYMPVYERLSVYPLIVWSFLTGIFLLLNNNSH